MFNLKGESTGTKCENCGENAQFMCSNCKASHYCSKKCQVVIFSILLLKYKVLGSHLQHHITVVQSARQSPKASHCCSTNCQVLIYSITLLQYKVPDTNLSITLLQYKVPGTHILHHITFVQSARYSSITSLYCSKKCQVLIYSITLLQ